MEIISNRDEMIFRNDYNGKPFYSIGLVKKDKDGNYVNGYMNVSFKKDVELENQTKIHINKAWIDFYNKDRKTFPYIFISEFDVIRMGDKNPYEELNVKTESQIGEQIEIEDSDLPF